MGRALPKLLQRFQQHLPTATHRAQAVVMAEATRRGLELFLVGGGVRDLLLGTPHDDVDLVVEADASALARAVGRSLEARVVEHPRFGTAVVTGRGFRLDLARARAESYPRPGALPSVRPASLAEDLARRDFTVNAMAVRLVGEVAGELIDPHGGRRDVRTGRIRTLHDASFRDDATRALRAVRYAGRLGFRLSRTTEACLRRDLGFVDTVSGPRLRREFEYIAGEEQVSAIVGMAARYGVFDAVHPALAPDARARRAAAGLPGLSASHRDAALFCLLLSRANAVGAAGATARLSLTARQSAALRGFMAMQCEEALCRRSLKPSEAVELLSCRPLEAVEALALVGPAEAARRARRYLDEWRSVKQRLNGDEVRALGVAAGPPVGAMLRLLRAARLDGGLQTRDEEVAFVRRHAVPKVEVAGG